MEGTSGADWSTGEEPDRKSEGPLVLLIEILHFAALYVVVKTLFAIAATHLHDGELGKAFAFLGF